jgi:hypothetical protein
VGPYPWPYRSPAGKAQGFVDSLCMRAIGELWTGEQTLYMAQGKTKQYLLSDLRMDERKRDVLGLAVQQMVARNTIAISPAAGLTVNGRDLDLIPPPVFKRLTGKSVEESGLPLVILPHRDPCFPSLCGVLALATRQHVINIVTTLCFNN